VSSRPQGDAAADGLDDEVRLARSVDDVRIVADVVIHEALAALPAAAGCDLDRAQPVREGNGMHDGVRIAEPDRA
jgi:hypothetical protein